MAPAATETAQRIATLIESGNMLRNTNTATAIMNPASNEGYSAPNHCHADIEMVRSPTMMAGKLVIGYTTAQTSATASSPCGAATKNATGKMTAVTIVHHI